MSKYSYEYKLLVVKVYLAGEGRAGLIAKKYNVKGYHKSTVAKYPKIK